MDKNRIEILDCTIRDGGYINDWTFGDSNAQKIVRAVWDSGVDYSEVGFLRLEEYKRDRQIFSNMAEISDIFQLGNKSLSVMVEIGYGYPVTKFPQKNDTIIDLVRIVVWKRHINQGLEYCKKLKDLGYDVAIQATRTDQYTPDEFVDLIEKCNQFAPKAVYIVDTFGLFTKSMLLEYAGIADNLLQPDIRIGYHAHNNMQQAFSNTIALIDAPYNHNLIIDASIMGMGRGAGNLPLELIEDYLNKEFGLKYNISPLYSVAESILKPIYEGNPWGYSIPYHLSAYYGCNPNYVNLFRKMDLSYQGMEKMFMMLKENDCGIIYDENTANRLHQELTK